MTEKKSLTMQTRADSQGTNKRNFFVVENFEIF